eukprot:TRINITY_DN175_c0_g1_i1.p2 TRINITY_DN175_c0_g1~~TRINITY_DN175_c0_g1_i1.p2  ORF type:complete len:245 (+),score=83.26 TRINITY_DN175_c0_g1_i1:1531-2265(+)
MGNENERQHGAQPQQPRAQSPTHRQQQQQAAAEASPIGVVVPPPAAAGTKSEKEDQNPYTTYSVEKPEPQPSNRLAKAAKAASEGVSTMSRLVTVISAPRQQDEPELVLLSKLPRKEPLFPAGKVRIPEKGSGGIDMVSTTPLLTICAHFQVYFRHCGALVKYNQSVLVNRVRQTELKCANASGSLLVHTQSVKTFHAKRGEVDLTLQEIAAAQRRAAMLQEQLQRLQTVVHAMELLLNTKQPR